MKKTLFLLLSGVVLLAAPVSFTSCDEKDEPEIETIDGEVHDPMYGKFQKYVEDVVGTFHYDEEISEWYAEDENHARFYFVFTTGEDSVLGAVEGKQVVFRGDLYSVSAWWFEDHEQYRKYKETGLNVYEMDSPRGKYIIDGKTYVGIDIRLNKL